MPFDLLPLFMAAGYSFWLGRSASAMLIGFGIKRVLTAAPQA